jgi:Zn-dependent membrane protease YugP
MVLELLLLGMLLASVLAHYLERTRREREAGMVLPFSGGYVLRKRGIPYRLSRQDGFFPVFRVVWLRRETAEGRTVKDVTLAAHEAAHALRFERGERWAWMAYYVLIFRWMLLGSGLTLAFLLNPAAIGVLALAYGVGLLFIPEEEAASAEAMGILREEGLREEELERARRLLEVYGKSYWLVPLAALALLGGQAVGL